MSYAVGGIGIVSGTIHHPARGTWTADLELNSEIGLGGAQTLSLPGLDLKGYVVGGGVSVLRQRVRMVGGKGGLSRIVGAQHFNGATVRTVVNFLLGKVGETLSADSDSAILAQSLEHWQHLKGSAALGLDDLMGEVKSTWSVTPAGEVKIGAPSWGTVEPDHELEAEDLVAGTLTIYTPDEVVQPGSSFRGKRVGSVEHVIAGGRVRSILHWGVEAHPFDVEMKAAVQHHQIQYMFPMEGKVQSQNQDGTLEIIAADPDIGGDGWSKVPLYLVGTAAVKIAPGARCVVEFLDNNQAKPFVRSFLAGTFTEISETATTKIDSKAPEMNLGNTMAAMTLAGSAKPVVRIGDVLAAGLLSNGFPVTGTIAIAPVISTVKA